MPGPAFTIGHSTHERAEFLGLLGRHSIEVVADVRAHPRSRRVPWFDAGELPRWLGEHGIEYAHLPELGGRRRPVPGSTNAGWKNESFRGYADHMGSSVFRRGLERLLGLAEERPTAAMCAEAIWWRCHRRLLADALIVAGADVRHIDARGDAAPHEVTPFAVIEDGGLLYPPTQPSLEL